MDHSKFKYYLFGSENSKDYDIIVDVDSVPDNVDEAHRICKNYNSILSEIFTDKPINCNIGVFKNNQIIDVFKGTIDEINNVLYFTYKNHYQEYPNPINTPIERNIDLKIIRVARFILSFYSRTHLRSEIKSALRGSFREKINTLKKINFVEMTDFPNKRENPSDIYKVLAFQFGQVFSLLENKEEDSYTKNGIIKNYPDLSNLINRNQISKSDLSILNKYLEKYILMSESKMSTIKQYEDQ